MKNLKIQILMLLLVLFTVLIGCKTTSGPIPAEQPTAATLAPLGQAKEAWEEEWQKTLKAAQKEGEIVVHSVAGANVREAFTERFQTKYGIRLDWLSLRGNESTAKLQSERRAGLYTTDVVQGGSTTFLTVMKPAGILAPLEPALILPDLVDPERIKKLWWNGKLGWLDPEHLVLAPLAYPSAPLAINTNLVKAGEIKSYKDLLDPKWKGKILMDDPTIDGKGGKWFGVVAAQDMDFMRQLVRQEPFISRDRRLNMEWLARGKYSIMISPNPSELTPFKEMGAPVMVITVKEGTYLTSGGTTIVLLDKVPHPNAAKIFINFMFTQEGQTLLSQSYGNQSRRLDVTTQRLEPDATRDPGAKYYESDAEEAVLKLPEMRRLAQEMFAPLMK